MKRQTPPKSPKDFVALLNELDDAVPMGDEEAAEILREAGIDSSRELKRAMVLVEEEEKRQQKALFERAGIERRAVLNQPRKLKKPRTEQELVLRLHALQRLAPPGSQLNANFNRLEGVPSEDLESIVSDFEELLGLDPDDEKKDEQLG